MKTEYYFLASNDKEFHNLDKAYLYLNLQGYNDTQIYLNAMILDENGNNATK